MNFSLSPHDLDIMARTIAGEAGGEGPLGMQAVGEVILNRLGAGGFGGSAADVALAPNQFSAWNAGEGGNSIPRATGPGQGGYEQAMAAALAALGGDDPTMGATHYYAPQGMPGGREPDWWGEVAAMGSTSIGNHRFAGGSQARGILAQALSGKAPEGPPTEAGADTYTRAGNQAALEAQAPVGHWTQGLANALNMGYSGYMDRLALEQGAGAETAENDAAAAQAQEAARIAAEQEAYNRSVDAHGMAMDEARLAMDMQPAPVEPGYRLATPEEVRQYGMPGQINEATGEFKPLPKDSAGMTVYDPATGNPIMTTGSPAAVAADTTQTQGKIVIEDLGRAKELILAHPVLTTGIIGNFAKEWAGTPGADVNALLDTVGANISFEALSKMRQASKTGAALGAITERELELLRATAGSISQAQSSDQLVENIERLERQFGEIVNGPMAGESDAATGGIPQSAVDAGIDPELWQFMTPADQALWQ